MSDSASSSSLISELLTPIPVAQLSEGIAMRPPTNTPMSLLPRALLSPRDEAQRTQAKSLLKPRINSEGPVVKRRRSKKRQEDQGNETSAEMEKLDKALNIEPYLNRLQAFSYDSDSSSDSDSSAILDFSEVEARYGPISKRYTTAFDKMKRRKRLIEVDLRDPEDDSDQELNDVSNLMSDEQLKELLKFHVKRKKLRRRVRLAPEQTLTTSFAKPGRLLLSSSSASELQLNSLFIDEDTSQFSDLGDASCSFLDQDEFSYMSANSIRNFKAGGSKRRDKSMSIEQLNYRRKRLWVAIMKKEIAKSHKARNFTQKEKMANCKRVSNQCMRAVRQKAIVSQRAAKETVWRAKRLTREMQSYWKRFDRVEKQQKRQQEKEMEEQYKMDVQLLEAKRQQRKLNFLITQTELFAHFIAKKIGSTENEDVGEETILKRLEEDTESENAKRLAEIDDYDSTSVKTMALNNASQAVEQQEMTTCTYDEDTGGNLDSKKALPEKDRSQPNIFNGTLKVYQLKGMNWLMNLYDQGINGILADEMGLGKTVQALAMLSYISEKYNIWGPFLVITPASTLHNWQQEVSRFVPSFKVIPYWGSPQERKILRQFWNQKNLHRKSASFHLVITSYQLVVSDFKYFNRIKWQYLILDEAQAIKSSSSIRWKMLLEFKCRNRLLLSGTPIQNTMAELWALLHFVMPSIFDSHDEFNDWFSKDIESSAESKSQVDEKQISRLHMILKPFMLRRIKKDVENELTDKLEILLYCPLTIRQKLLYMGLKKKIKVEELLKGLGSQNQNSAIASSLMNLVMQFRKVCNHPELFERRDTRSPFAMNTEEYLMPKLLCHESIHSNRKSIAHWIDNRLSIFNPHHVHTSLKTTRKSREYLEVCDSTFSYLHFVDTSPQEQFQLFQSLLNRLLHISSRRRTNKEDSILHNETWNPAHSSSRTQLLLTSLTSLSSSRRKFSPTLSNLLFTRADSNFLHHVDVALHRMQETVAHRLMRARKINKNCDINQVVTGETVKFEEGVLPPQLLKCQRCPVPRFLLDICPGVCTSGRVAYCSDRSFAYIIRDHLACSGQIGRDCILYGSPELAADYFDRRTRFRKSDEDQEGGLYAMKPMNGFSNIIIPDKQSLVSDCGKLHVLDGLLARLKTEGHRVLIYSQMTKMIDLLEEFMWHRKHTYMRLDGSSKISDRRDMVADFQQRSDIFVFLLSTRAGGLGINLTAADTVIFYDSDWNPTVDQQAMDRAHRLGQTKQVTVYRLICKGTIEERILQRAREKSEIQRMVIQGGSSKGKGGVEFKPKEVMSLLLDDEEMEKKVAKIQDDEKGFKKRKVEADTLESKKQRVDEMDSLDIFNAEDSNSLMDTNSIMFPPDSSGAEDSLLTSTQTSRDPTRPPSPLLDFMGEKIGPKRGSRGTGGKRGRPKGSKRSSSTDINNKDSEDAEKSDDTSSAPTLKRGPGRPRLKAEGVPLNQGSRGPVGQK